MVDSDRWLYLHGSLFASAQTFLSTPNARPNLLTSTTCCATKMSSFGVRISANRVAGNELSVPQRDSVISKHEAGCITKELAEEFGRSRRAISNTIRRYAQHSKSMAKRSSEPSIDLGLLLE